jgi:transposase
VRRKFSDEFKRDAVEIVRSSGKPIAEVARELGIYDSTLGSWVKQDQVNRGEREGLSTDERQELGELRRENARLRMERELLKRAAAFWVKESTE